MKIPSTPTVQAVQRWQAASAVQNVTIGAHRNTASTQAYTNSTQSADLRRADPLAATLPPVTLARSGADASIHHSLAQRIAPLLRTGALARGYSTLPAPVHQLTQQLNSLLSSPASLASGVGLKSAIYNSGVFFEAKLAAGASRKRLDNDLKGALLRLARSLHRLTAATPESGALKHSAEASLRHLLGMQHDSLAQSETERSAINLELPVRTHDGLHSLRMRIAPEGRCIDSDQQMRAWCVDLAMELGDHGAIGARVSLFGDTARTAFWAESSATVALINAHMAELDESLAREGLRPVLGPCVPGTMLKREQI